MKRCIITLIMAITTWQIANAMSYEQAREEALYLTDKMAYELNLNDQQYNDAYEINLDYFLSLNAERDLYEDYLSYRLSDLRHILYDWQYNLMIAADYFIRPVYWRSGGWYFSIYNHYNHGYFYYSYPTVYYSYRGGHGRLHHHHGFYADRRPAWNGGLRGNHPISGRISRNGHELNTHERGGRIHGDGYHIDIRRRGDDRMENGRSDRGNSFGNSSSRNQRNDFSRRSDDARTNPRTGNGPTERGNYNSDRTSRSFDTSRSYNSNRNHDGVRSPGTSRNGSSMSHGSGRGGFSSSRGSNGGGSVSRGRR